MHVVHLKKITKHFNLFKIICKVPDKKSFADFSLFSNAVWTLGWFRSSSRTKRLQRLGKGFAKLPSQLGQKKCESTTLGQLAKIFGWNG